MVLKLQAETEKQVAKLAAEQQGAGAAAAAAAGRAAADGAGAGAHAAGTAPADRLSPSAADARLGRTLQQVVAAEQQRLRRAEGAIDEMSAVIAKSGATKPWAGSLSRQGSGAVAAAEASASSSTKAEIEALKEFVGAKIELEKEKTTAVCR